MPPSGLLPDPQNLVCLSKLMQNYKAEVPVSVGGQIALATDARGELVIFSLSSANNVLCLRPDPASDTGWRQTATGLVAMQIGVGLTASGTLLIVAPGPGTSLTIVEETSGGWGAPQTVSPQTNDNPSPIVQVAAQNAGGTLYISYFLAPDPSSSIGGPPYVGWIGAWDDTSKTIVNPFPTMGLDPCALVPGTDAAGQASYFAFWTPRIYTRLTTQYLADNVYWDKGSGTPMNLAFWRPVPVNVYGTVGDLALGGKDYHYTAPTTPMLTLSPVVDFTRTIPAVTYSPSPQDYQLVWSDQHSGADENGAVWVPQQAGYVALGYVATRNYQATQQSLPASQYMVRADLVSPATLYEPIPNCESSEAENCNQVLIYANFGKHSGTKELAVDPVLPGTGGVGASAFYAHADWNMPTGPAWCLNASPALNSIAVRFDPTSDYTAGCSPVGVPSPSAVVMSATAVDAGGTTRFFAILADQKIYFLDQTANAWICLDPVRTYAGLAPARNASGHLEVFAIGTDRALYHVRQNARAPGGWGQMVPIEALNQYAEVVAGHGGAGHSMAFAVTATGGLWRFFQDPATTTWSISEIELEDLGTVQEIRTFTTEISVSDANRVPQADYPVTVWSDDLVAASINGDVFLLDATPRVSRNTDASGKLTVTVETTELNAPVLYIRTAAMELGESVSIVPNADIQSTLLTVDGATLKEKLGVDRAKADHAAKAINAAMSLAQKPAATGDALKYLRLNRDRRGLHCRKSDAEPSPGRIDLSAVPEQHWRVELTGGVRFTALTATEAEAIMARELATLPAPQSFLHWFGDLGDLFEAVVDGIASVVSYTVSVIAKGVRAAVTFIVDGITYAFYVVVGLVEQAFDIIGTIFAAIGVAFEKLVEWLGFLFNWPDIVRTKNALAHAVLQTLPLAKIAATTLQKDAAHRIAGLKSQLQDSVHKVLQNVLGTDSSPISFNEAHGTPPQAMDAAAGTNIVLSGFTANADGAAPVTSRASGGALPGAVTDFLTLLERHAGPDSAFQQSEGFANAFAYLKQIGDQPDQFMRLLFGAVLSALEGVAEAALDLAQSVVDAFFAAIANLVDLLLTALNTPWNIPYVSALYTTYISPGSELTALDLFCLIAAIPTTVMYKVVTNAAPFPDPTALDQFKANYTTAWLEQISGLSGSTARTIADPPPSWRELLRLVFGLALAGSYAAYCPVQFVLDSYTVLGPTQPSEGWGTAALALEGCIWVFSLPWANPENNSGFGCDHGDEAGNLIWITFALTPLAVDIGCFVAQKRIARNISNVGVVLDFAANLVVMAGAVVSIAKGSTRGWVFGITIVAAVISTLKAVRFTPITTALCEFFDPTNAGCPKLIAGISGIVDLFGNLVSAAMTVVVTIYIEDENGVMQPRPTLGLPPPSGQS